MAWRWKFWESPIKTAIANKDVISPSSTQSATSVEKAGLTQATQATGQTVSAPSTTSRSSGGSSSYSSGGQSYAPLPTTTIIPSPQIAEQVVKSYNTGLPPLQRGLTSQQVATSYVASRGDTSVVGSVYNAIRQSPTFKSGSKVIDKKDISRGYNAIKDSPTYTAGSNVGSKVVDKGYSSIKDSPTFKSGSAGVSIGESAIKRSPAYIKGGRIAQPQIDTINKILENTYNKPQDVGVTRWLSTAGPEKVGSKTQQVLDYIGAKEIDMSIPTSIIQPTLNVMKYSGKGADTILRSLGKKEDTSISKWITSFSIPKIPDMPLVITSSTIGKGAKGVASVGQYFVPGYGEALIYGGLTESAVGGAFGGDKSVQSYVKNNPMETLLVGAYSGVKLYPFVSGYLRTATREKIPYSIVPEKVSTGQQQFWSEGKGSVYDIAKQHKKLFTDSKYGLPTATKDVITPYHATGSVFWKNEKLVVGESPLHVAPGVSANFLKIGGGEGYSGFSLTAPFKRSGVISPQINIKDIIIRQGYEAQRGTYVWKGATPPSGKLVIPVGGKTEVQGLLLTGTEGSLIQKKYYSTWKGVRYPIDEFKIIGGSSTLTTPSLLPGKNSKVLSYSGLPSTSGGGYRGLGSIKLDSSSKSSTPSYSNLVPSVTYSTPSNSVSSYLSSVTKSSGRSSSRSSGGSRVSTPSYTKIMSSVLPSSSKSKMSKSSTPSYSSLLRPSKSYSSLSRSGSYSSSYKPKTPYGLFKYKPAKQQRGTGRFNLFVKQKGIWKPKGTFLNMNKALFSGRSLTGLSIDRSFKITGGKVGLLKGYRWSRAKGQKNVLVELPKTALSQSGEQFQIKTAKRKKKKKKGVFEW